MKTLLKLIPKTRHHRRRLPPKPTGGFTMIELLVGMIIAALIITPMLAFVVNILNNDVREQAKTNTEQDLQAAMDYIAQDMSQAVYVYDPDYAGDTANGIPSYATFEAQLPHSSDANKTPILVFWKRQIVEDAVPVSGNDCSAAGCDDTFVMSLVAYYKIDETSTASVWCEQTPCPSRIGRFQIRDGVKDLNGNYICAPDGRTAATGCTDEHMRDSGYSSLDISVPTAWTANGEGYDDDVVTLINYAEGFDLNSVDDNKLANITIVGNALRRSQSDFSCEDASATPPYKNSPYCPKATARVGARSGFGEE